MDQILFLSLTIRTKSCYSQECFTYDKKEKIQTAARLLGKDIVKKLDDNSDLSWPATLEAVSDDSREPPDSVYMFLQKLLNPRNKASANVSRVIESLAQDIAFAVMKGKVLQIKQFLLTLGLHSLTGRRKVINIIHKLGHCMSFNLTSEIETAQAESSLLAAIRTALLPVVPATPSNAVFTISGLITLT